MSKVEYRFLQGLKQEEFKQQKEKQRQKGENTYKSTNENTYAENNYGESTGLEMFSDDLYSQTTTSFETTSFETTSFETTGFDDSLYNNSTANEPIASIENFEDNLYMQQELIRKNTDEFIQYITEFDSKVSAKEARTSIESRLPFIVDKADFKSFSNQKASKRNKKSAIIRETDNIYKPYSKMRKSGLTSEFEETTPERIGYITVTKTPQLDKSFNSNLKPTRAKAKTKQLDKIAGILNEKFIIHKKKGFNKKKLGYLPVELAEIQTLDSFENITEDEIMSTKTSKSENERVYYDRLYTQKKLLEREQERKQGSRSGKGTQKYVEIVEDRGMGHFIFLAALIIVIWFSVNTLLNSPLADGWSLDGLNLIKTEEQTNYEETNLELTMNATPTLKNNELNINISSVEIDGIKFTVEFIDNETKEVIYKSTELNSGTEIEQIELNERGSELYQNNTEESLYKQATVRCETFKDGKFIGEIEQNIEIKIKPQE